MPGWSSSTTPGRDSRTPRSNCWPARRTSGPSSASGGEVASGREPQDSAAVTNSGERRKPTPVTAVRYAQRVVHTARNVAEVVRFGGLETDEEESPYTVAVERLHYRLRRYLAASSPFDAAPVFL